LLLLAPLLPSARGSLPHAFAATPGIAAIPSAADDALKPQRLELNGRIDPRDSAPPGGGPEGDGIAVAGLNPPLASLKAGPGAAKHSDLPCTGLPACRTSHPRAPPT
jgi:hypothetical protein